MTSDPLLLAPCLVASDYTADLLLSMAGFPASSIARERGNALRRWRRAGWVEDFGVRLSGRPYVAPVAEADADDARTAEAAKRRRAVWDAMQAGFRGSVAALAVQLGAVDATSQPTRALEHAIEAAVEDGWLLPVRAVVLTEAGRAAVMADPDARAAADDEWLARAAARDLARVTDADVAAIDAETRGLLALAELTRGRAVPRAQAEDRSRLGLPTRTVPRHRGRAHALSGGDPTWPVRARGGR